MRWRRPFLRSGALTLFGVAASLFLGGCQSTSKRAEEAKPVEVASEPPDLGERPSEAELAARPSEAELRELEEELQLRSGQSAEGRRPRSLREQAERHGLTVERATDGEHWTVRGGSNALVLKEESRIAELNGVKVFLDAPFGRDAGRWRMSDSDERLLLAGFMAGAEASGRRPVRTIVIDPGHGGTETGTRNDALALLEKEVNLDVSQRLQKHLESRGFKAALTRYDDRLVTLEQRPEIARGMDADLFVSVHFNAALNKEAQGLETYMLTPAGQPSTASQEAGEEAVAYAGNRFDVANLDLAYRIQKVMTERLKRVDRGVKKARFGVLKHLDAPGVLVEGGFLSNREESALISTPGYRERLALALADAIEAYARGNAAGQGNEP